MNQKNIRPVFIPFFKKQEQELLMSLFITM